MKKSGTPRLELLAVLIVQQLCTRATSTPYGKEIPLNWTDNQCVLHWIMGKKPLITFVQNQVKEITETKDISFRYVETSQNPADI